MNTGHADDAGSPLPVPSRLPATWRLTVAARIVARGGVIAYPTEGVYGLGCDPLNPEPIARLIGLKERRPGQGFIIVGATPDQLDGFIGQVTEAARSRLQTAWPGPITFVVPASTATPRWLTGAGHTIGLRVPDHPLVRALCGRCGPLVSTSANRRGQPPALTLDCARRRFGSSVDYYFPGPVGARGRPSDVVVLESGQRLR